MHIAVVADDLYPGFGGQAVATEGHIEALVARGHTVTALAGTEKAPSAAPNGVTVMRVAAWQPGETQTSFAFPDLAKIRAILRGADVLQVNTPTPLGLMAVWLAKRRKLPCVIAFYTQEESATTHFTPPLSTVIGGLLRVWYSFFYGLADTLSVLNPFSARLMKRYTTKPTQVVSGGIRYSTLRGYGDALTSTRKAAWLEGKTYLLSYVGRLAPEKRPLGMLEIMSALKNLRADVRLLIAGRGPLLKELEMQVNVLGLGDSVRFLGFVSEEDKAQLLRASDIFIMPSPTELQSIATIEAMAQGCAILAAQIDSSAVSEMIQQANCGSLYDLGQPSAAAQMLSDLLNNPAKLEQYKCNAQTCAETHDLAHSAAALEGLYQSLAAQAQVKHSF